MSTAPEKVPALTRLFSGRARRKSAKPAAKATPASLPSTTEEIITKVAKMPQVEHTNGNGNGVEVIAPPAASPVTSVDETTATPAVSPALASQEVSATTERTSKDITKDENKETEITPVGPPAVAPRDIGKGKQLDGGSTTSVATVQAKKRKGDKSAESSKVKAAKTSPSTSSDRPPKAAKSSFFGKLVKKFMGSSSRSASPAPPPPAATDSRPSTSSAPVLINTAVAGPSAASSIGSQPSATSELLGDLSLAPANPVTADDEPAAPTPIDADADIVISPPTHILPVDVTQGVTSGAVQPPGSTADDLMHPQPHIIIHHGQHANSGDETDDGSGSDDYEEALEVGEIEDEEARLIASGGAGIPRGPDGSLRPLLPPISAEHKGRKCLVLDLDETLVHSSIKFVQQADYVVPVEIEQNLHNFYVLKRPGVDQFLQRMGEIYEVVVFTASLSKYADPVLDRLDPHKTVTHRLFRESCFNHKGNYVKDLSQLGRPIGDTIILDNSPASYIFHPTCAVPVSSWFNDPHDTELTDLCPFLVDLATVPDIRGVLDDKL